MIRGQLTHEQAPKESQRLIKISEDAASSCAEIEIRGFIINWNLTRHQYMADFFVVPLFAVAAVATAWTQGRPHVHWAWMAVLGYLAWTLTEYVMHRWGFHTLYRRDHARHHVRPLEWIGVMPWVSAAALAAIWVLCIAATRDAANGSIVFAGYAAGYYVYIATHWLIHHSDLAIVATMRNHHALHHRRARVNFGVSTRLWDVVFQTRA